MNNYQFLYEKEQEKNKLLELKLDVKETWSHHPLDLAKINKLKKQIESMRNCFNCGEMIGIYNDICGDNNDCSYAQCDINTTDLLSHNGIERRGGWRLPSPALV